tara:strand:+ start:211 stop:390 length:180 start_codon:yes stop_codon:yes gene_type:complete
MLNKYIYMGNVQSKEKFEDIKLKIKRKLKSILRYMKRDRRAEYIYSQINQTEYEYTDNF